MKVFITKDRMKNKGKLILTKFISVIVLLIMWYLVALGVGSELRLPSPKVTFLSMIDILKDPSFIAVVGSTLFRGFIALLLSITFAIVLGFAAGMIDFLEELLKPYITIIRSTPTMALIFILLTTFSSGVKASIAICFLVIFPLIYSNVVKGVKTVDQSLIQMAKLYQVSKINIIKDIYFPSIKNYIYAGVSAAIGLNFKIMISAEVIGEVKGSIGKELYFANATLNKPEVFAWCILLIIMVWIIDFMCSYILENRREFHV